jgi:transcriptional regulator with XRE-family HTH domain
MAKNNLLLTTPPYPVEQSLNQLGVNLRTARIRRGLTIAEVAEKIGAGVRAVANAENGKPSTGIAVYFALLWVYDLLKQMDEVADPAKDTEGQALALAKEPSRARESGDNNNDF